MSFGELCSEDQRIIAQISRCSWTKKAKFEIQDDFKNTAESKYFVFLVLFSSLLIPHKYLLRIVILTKLSVGLEIAVKWFASS